VLAALRRRELELGRPPTSSELQRPPGPQYPSTSIVRRQLGSWAAACRELGWELKTPARHTEPELLSALRAARSELGERVIQNAYSELATRRAWPSATAVKRRFGTWTAAKRASGLACRTRVAVWSEQEIVAALQASSRELGRAPTLKEWKALAGERGWPSATVLTAGSGAGIVSW
jgi:Homing endonuclease associated repeat